MVDVFIIGIKGRLRSKSLAEWSDSGKSADSLTFVDPVSYTRKQVPPLLDLYTGLHYGNRLTDGEWGCSLAHLRAQTLALSMSCEWALFLEDDAQLSNDFFQDLDRLVSILPRIGNKSIGVQCFGPKSSTRLTRDRMKLDFNIGSPPSGTVGYLLNRASLQLAKQSEYKGHPIGKADFPAWSHRVKWAAAKPPIVFHDEDLASMVGARDLASRHRGHLFKLAHALTRVLLYLLPIIKIENRLAWELDFILKPIAED